MKEKLILQNFKQFMRLISIFLITLSLNFSIVNSSQSNLSIENDITDFHFTDNNILENYDYDNDGQADILVVNLEINVVKTGLISFKGLCNPPVLYWNSTSEMSSQSPLWCTDLGGSIIDLKTSGLMNLTIWYGYGILLPDLSLPDYTYMQNANLSFNYNFFAFDSNGEINTNIIVGPSFNATLADIHSFSRTIDQKGIANTMLLEHGSELFSGRSASDSYKWWYHFYYNFSAVSNPDNYSGYITSNFESFSSSYVKMFSIRTFENGTFYDNSSAYYFLDKELYSGGDSFAQYLIPQNTNPSDLSKFYNLIWNCILKLNTQYYNNLSNTIIGSHSVDNYFETNFSFEFDTNYSNNPIHNQFNLTLKYDLPNGLLSYLSITQFQNDLLYQNQTAILIQPVPNDSSNSNSSTNTLSTHSETFSNSNSIITTIDFSLDPLLVGVPLLLSVLLIRKKNN